MLIAEEAERITQSKGRVFCLHDEPGVYRVWMPNGKTPGLSLSRAFGDHCVKDFGLVSEPDVTRRNISSRDQFVILATDGVCIFSMALFRLITWYSMIERMGTEMIKTCLVEEFFEDRMSFSLFKRCLLCPNYFHFHVQYLETVIKHSSKYSLLLILANEKQNESKKNTHCLCLEK